MAIRCLVLDDEPLATDILSDYVGKVSTLDLVAVCHNAMDALVLIQQGKVDLAFVDIQMPDLTGLQFLRVVNGKCKAILTTAYQEYALNGYEYDVIDYLLKPISFERFLSSVQKAQERFHPAPDAVSVPSKELPPKNETILSARPIAAEFIFVKTEYKIIKINLTDILFIEGLKDYVSIYTPTERILSLQTMKKMEEVLPGPRFMRVHKSYIVAMDKIESIERQRIFIGKHVIPVGESYVKEFAKRIE
ncbi:LytR/AlgR family response regulator transcription factor [Dyadobacter arcticus]|uniref:DNA-binding LytR/AlgR family response regulator n=1 Tax=Dyadobacter arcticus TaxID=1078754 RepID=A0ABX0UHZ2_9BACT|nr:LytTR family DNA-binding domain-containing protein [Dyadobacter arcticus]NIJ51005.1 DNA-binding LytR/AlgR family response regulator [Dyadobacter arcticus]